jgi:hypothetical protein
MTTPSATSLRDALFFELEDDTDVHLCCPECYDVLWLTKGYEVKTLADVVKAARAHVCYPEDGS